MTIAGNLQELIKVELSLVKQHEPIAIAVGVQNHPESGKFRVVVRFPKTKRDIISPIAFHSKIAAEGLRDAVWAMIDHECQKLGIAFQKIEPDRTLH